MIGRVNILCRSIDGERKNKVAEIADIWSRVSEKKEWRTENTLVTSELVESHIPAGSFPVLRDSSWGRNAEVEKVEWVKTSCSSPVFTFFSLFSKCIPTVKRGDDVMIS